MTRLTLAIGFFLMLAGFTGTASAQSRYTPPGGRTLPIELDYFRPQQGVLDNYNQFVAPKFQLANQLQTLDKNQRTSFGTLERKIQETNNNIRSSQAAVTGTSAGFMNYSHYYNRGGGGGGGRGR